MGENHLCTCGYRIIHNSVSFCYNYESRSLVRKLKKYACLVWHKVVIGVPYKNYFSGVYVCLCATVGITLLWEVLGISRQLFWIYEN